MISYNSDLMKRIFGKAFPTFPATELSNRTQMLRLAAEAHFVGRLELDDYEIAVLQAAQRDIIDHGYFVDASEEAVAQSRDGFFAARCRGLR